MKKLLIFLMATLFFVSQSCSSREYTDEYWRAINTENSLRKSGLNGLADEVRRERQRLFKQGYYDVDKKEAKRKKTEKKLDAARKRDSIRVAEKEKSENLPVYNSIGVPKLDSIEQYWATKHKTKD